MLPIHFAPLQGYTEAPYRRIHQEVCGGIQSYYTPFIRLEHGNIRHKDLREALPAHNEGVPVVPQVIAANAAEFVPLADKLLSIGHKRIDINMGCPFPLQTRLGRGSGLLPHAEQVAEILQEAQRLTHEQGAQFSVKMRLGQDAPTEWEPLLPLLNATPLVHITLHARDGREQYKGALHLDQFEAFYEQSTHPVIYNGLLTSVQEMQEVEQCYPRLGGLMIGRGLLARPTLAMEYVQGHQLTPAECRLMVLEMHRRLFAHYQQAIEGGESQLVMKMKSFWEYLDTPEATAPIFTHKAIKKILKSGSMRNYQEAVANA